MLYKKQKYKKTEFQFYFFIDFTLSWLGGLETNSHDTDCVW